MSHKITEDAIELLAIERLGGMRGWQPFGSAQDKLSASWLLADG